jgi:hypothetical protein
VIRDESAVEAELEPGGRDVGVDDQLHVRDARLELRGQVARDLFAVRLPGGVRFGDDALVGGVRAREPAR